MTMSQPLFVIVSDDESGGDNSVHTAVLDDKGHQKVVALSEANQFRQIPKEPKFSVIPRTPSGLAQWNANHRVTRYKCDMCAENFSKPYLLRNHRHRVHNVCLETKSVPTRKSRAGKEADKVETPEETLGEQIPYKDFVPKRHLSAEEVRREKLEKLIVKDTTVAIQIAAELESLKKSEPKRPRYVSRKKYPCHICGKPFASPSLLERHRSVHTRERLYPCPHCPKKCAYTDERLRHIRRAHPEQLSGDKTLEKYPSCYTCSICDGKTFTTKYRYTEHLKVHLNGLFECQICNKKYAKRDNLIRHLQIHNGDKSHECEVCQKRFLDTSSLRSHQQTHTGDYRYKCGVCEKGFSKKKSLYDHLQRHNDEENGNVFECKVCWECLDSREDLEAHQKLHMAATSAAEPIVSSSPTATSASAEQQLNQLGYSPQTEHSDNRQAEVSAHPEDEHFPSHQTEHSGHMQVEFSGHAQSELSHTHHAQHSGHPQTQHSGHPQAEYSGHPQAEHSSHPQAEYSSHPQAEHSGHPQAEHSSHPHAEYSSHPQAEHSGHPQAEYPSHPAVDFSGHSIVDLSGHPRADFSGHPQAEYSVNPHSHASVTDVRGSSLELCCHTCNKSFQSPEEVRLHERLHNPAEQNSHHFSHNYMNSHSTVTYGGVSTTSSVYPANQMSLALDQPMTGTQHPHLLI